MGFSLDLAAVAEPLLIDDRVLQTSDDILHALDLALQPLDESDPVSSLFMDGAPQLGLPVASWYVPGSQSLQAAAPEPE